MLADFQTCLSVPLRYWFAYIFDMKTINVTFSSYKFNMLTSFTQINLFTCFFWKRLSNSVVIITSLLRKWCSHTKSLFVAPAVLVVPRFLWLTAALLKSNWWWDHYVASSHRGITIFTIKVYIWAYICKISQWLLSEHLSFSQLFLP